MAHFIAAQLWHCFDCSFFLAQSVILQIAALFWLSTALLVMKYRTLKSQHRIVVGSDVGGGGSWGASTLPKVLICWKSGENPWKSGQNFRKSRQNTWKSGRKWRSTFFDFKKWHPTFAEKHMKTFSLRGHIKRGLYESLLWEKIWKKKSHKLFEKVWENSGKNPSHPQKFACSYTCGSGQHWHNWQGGKGARRPPWQSIFAFFGVSSFFLSMDIHDILRFTIIS